MEDTTTPAKKSKKGILTGILLGIILIAFVGFIIWKFQKDFGSTNSGKTSTSSPITGIGDIPGATINVLPNPPSLTELVNYKKDIQLEIKAAIAPQISDTRKKLEQDASLYGDWVILGTLYKQAGDYDKAIKAWEFAHALVPTEGTPLDNIGTLYVYEKQDYAKGEEYYRKAVSAEPKLAFTYRLLFELYTNSSYKANTNAAIDVLKEGLAANPTSIDLLSLTANYYKAKGDKANARKYFTEAIDAARSAGETKAAASFEAELSKLQ